jgi:hypothetical protein
VISSKLVDKFNKLGCIISLSIYIVSAILSFVISLFLVEDHRRLRAEKDKGLRDSLRDSMLRKSLPGV